MKYLLAAHSTEWFKSHVTQYGHFHSHGNG